MWSCDVFDVNLVEVHVSLLRRKLEEVGPRIVHTVRGSDTSSGRRRRSRSE